MDRLRKHVHCPRALSYHVDFWAIAIIIAYPSVIADDAGKATVNKVFEHDLIR